MLSFSYQHLTMAAFFAVLGTAFGIIQGTYIQRIATLYKKVKILSITDELTSLYNRRYFFKRIKEEIARARRYSLKLFLFIIDIDDFKHYNDKHGHQQGDDILMFFAQYLKKSVRTSDIVARYGGEEFVVILPEAKDTTALALAQRLCTNAASHGVPNNKISLQKEFTISVGIAGFPSDAQNAGDLLKTADRALYKAKREGKNRVCRHEAHKHISND